MNVKFSRWLAMGFGVLLPVLAIVRNWSLDKQDFWAFFADVISGAFLLFAVWKVSQKERVGKRYLAAAWGLVCGLFYSSFAYQVVTINAGSKPEMGEPMIPAEFSVAAAALGLLIVLTGLMSSLRSDRSR